MRCNIRRDILEMHTDKKWRSALWLNTMHSDKKSLLYILFKSLLPGYLKDSNAAAYSVDSDICYAMIY